MSTSLPPRFVLAAAIAAVARRRAAGGAVADARRRSTRRSSPSSSQGLKTEAVERGISREVAARALDGLTPLPVVVERDRGQAEAVLSIDAYVRRRLTPTIVRRAREMAVKHRTVLEKVGATYGVQPRYLVAVWGLESNFGRFTGVRPDRAGAGDAGLRRPPRHALP